MLLSVIVPVFNVERFVGVCLDSILAQDFSDFELIIVDDGSTDNSGKICDDYALRDERIRVIHKKNGGLDTARRTGIENASGDYVTFVDSDDMIESDMYSYMMNFVDTYSADIVICGIRKSFDDGSELLEKPAVMSGFFDKDAMKEKIYPRMLADFDFYRFGIYPAMWNKIYNRKILADIYDNLDMGIAMGEDAAVFYPAMLKAQSVYIIDDKFFYHYRIHQSSMCMSYQKKFISGNKVLISRLNRIFTENENCKTLKRQLIFYSVYMSYNGILNVFSRQNKMSFFDKKNVITDYLETEYIKQCFNDIDMAVLPKSYKLVSYLIRRNRYILLSLILYLRNILHG